MHEEKIVDLIDDFSFFEDWEERYAYLIDLGKSLPEFPEALRNDEYLVKGCTSRVWLILSWSQDQKLEIQADSDAHIVKGLVALVLRVYEGSAAEDILNVDMHDIFEKIGMLSHLSPNRRNGFFSMVEKIRQFAS